MIKYLTQCLVEYAQIINENGEMNEFTANRESKAEKELEDALTKYIAEKMPKYFLTRLTVKIEVPGPTHHPYYEEVEVDQLVMASDKDSAREAVIDACKKEHPKGVIIEARVHDTLIGK